MDITENSGYTYEELSALYYDKDALIIAPEPVYQITGKNDRYYYKFDDNGEPVFYPSVTTVLDKVMPKSEFLIKWMAQQGYEEAENYKNIRAKYGTFMHGLFEQLIIDKQMDLDGIGEKLKSYIESEKLPDSFYSNLFDFQKDVMAFVQWLNDYKVHPIAVEMSLINETDNIAGSIDLVCNLTYKKERITAIVDFKCGRNGFTEHHAAQLALYKRNWENRFPDIKIDKLFNFSPKDWRTITPTYNFKDQTENEWTNPKIIDALLTLANATIKKSDNFISVGGVVKIGDDYNAEDNISTISFAELALRFKKDASPESEPTESEPETSNQAPTEPVSKIDLLNDFEF